MRTGRFRFRQDWRGRQILEVELSSPGDRFCSYRVRSWIQGTPSDAATITQRLNGTTAEKPAMTYEEFKNSLALYM